MTNSDSTLDLQSLPRIFVGALLYLVLALANLSFFGDTGPVSSVWLPSGLGLAMLLIGGRPYLASIFIASALVNMVQAHLAWPVAAALAAGSTLEAVIGQQLLIRSGKFDPSFVRLRDLYWLILIAGCFGVGCGALVNTSILQLNALIGEHDFWKTLFRWWMGDALGIILMTPLILVWRNPPREWRQPKRLIEVTLILLATFLAGQIIFMGWMADTLGPYAKGFFMFLFIALAAVRLGIHGVATIVLIAAGQGVLGAVHGVGHFASSPQEVQFANYWLFMIALSIVGIMLATYIAAEKRDKEALREQEEFFHMITENIDDFIAVLDLQGRRLYNSPSYAKLFGDPRNMLNTDSFAEVHPDDREHVKQVFMDTVRTGVGQRIEFRFILPDGTVRDMESRGGIIRNENGQAMHVVVVSHDITERKKIDETIRNLAFYDSLTQLPNRRMLDDRLAQAMAASKRSGRFGALLFLDLDNFKPLNDQYGHNIGDLLLIEVARRISTCVRKVDTVARFGGDEFVVMLSALDIDQDESARQALSVAEKIRVSLGEPYFIRVNSLTGVESTIEHHCTASIGAVLFHNQDTSEDNLIKWADMAMYLAKEKGRNRIHFLDREAVAAMSASTPTEHP